MTTLRPYRIPIAVLASKLSDDNIYPSLTELKSAICAVQDAPFRFLDLPAEVREIVYHYYSSTKHAQPSRVTIRDTILHRHRTSVSTQGVTMATVAICNTRSH
jgi:hypothetical protein